MPSHQASARLLLIPIVLFLLTSCGESRSTQCDKLGSANNNAQQKVSAIYDRSIGQLAYDSARELELAEVKAQAAKDIEAVQVSDPSLQTIRSHLAEAYRQASAIARQTAAITPADGRPTDAIAREIDTLRGQADHGIPPAIHELTMYCIGG